ncbi:hypothetical protein P3L51_01760 [Streptomyces sp. PSRA5]|uniref:hypothetical protein n=1 Tax=Streptomyces panacea TaxID=3035064 RepID=UPI00339BF34E
MPVGGADAVLVDSRRSIGDRLPPAIGLVVVTTFLPLFLFTGSVVQPLRAPHGTVGLAEEPAAAERERTPAGVRPHVPEPKRPPPDPVRRGPLR